MNKGNFSEKLNLLNANILEAFNLTNENEIIGKFIDVGAKILDADFGYSFIKSPGSDDFSLAYITPGANYQPIGTPRKKGIVSKAFETRELQLVTNVPETGFIRFDAKSAMQSVAVVPITYQDKTFGTLHFAYYNTHEFLEEEKELCSYLGNIAAQAITINRMAYYDPLTGLPNRTLLKDRLAQAHESAEKNNGIYALLFIDLDRFKVINDIYNHHFGDELLKSVAGRIQNILPSKATVARMGGDEFLVLIPSLANPEEAHKYASNIQETFSEVFDILGQEIYSNTSIGYAVYPVDGLDSQTLMKHADLALHRSKDHGGGNAQQYRAGQSLFYNIQPKLHSQLKHAIKNNELTLRYQPIISTKTQQIVSCEALVRWNHPEMGMLFPGYFIGEAEESGLIVEIGEWVFNEACKQIKKWESDSKIPVPVSVNISPRELLRPNLVGQIQQTLKEHDVSVSQIKVELTETFLMKNIELSISILEQLKTMGLSISIDDFGTGYASLNYLKRLPIDTVKIDKSFIQGVPENLQDSALTSAIVTISHQLGLEVLAEGVETKSQHEYLRAIRCNYAQGNFFHKPLTGEKLGKLLKSSYMV